MEPLLKVQVGRLGKLIFTDNGNGIEEGKAEDIIRKKCEKIRGSEDEEGFLFYMSKKEYEKILREEDNYKGYQAMLRQYDKR